MENGKRIYIHLDSLFDLRMGVLNIINNDFALDVTRSKKYYTRVFDEFRTDKVIVTNKDYLNILSRFPDVVLRNSIKTKMINFLIILINKFIKESITAPVNYDISLDVNIYPFTLTEEEKLELVNILTMLTVNTIKINIVNSNITDLTIEYVNSNYRFMIMYEYHTWLNLHNDVLKKSNIRDTLLYVPMLYFDSIPTKDQLKELNKINKTPFELTAHILSPYISIDYLPIFMYCLDTPYNSVTNTM